MEHHGAGALDRADHLGLGRRELLLPAAVGVDMLGQPALHLVGHGDRREDQRVDGDEHHRHRHDPQRLGPALVFVPVVQEALGLRDQILLHSSIPSFHS